MSETEKFEIEFTELCDEYEIESSNFNEFYNKVVALAIQVQAPVIKKNAETKQGFYVKAKIQSKVDLKCVFVTDHLVHLDVYLPTNQIEHAIYDEIAKRIKYLADDKYEILAIEKIILALDNPPEMT